MKHFFVCLVLLAFTGCARDTKTRPVPAPQPSQRLTLYCSVDDVYAKPVIAHIKRKTGLQIDVLFDTEAAKTAGLANRIRAESARPRGDVFWSSALLQTLLLEREKLLQPYLSPNAKPIPAAFKAANGAWTSPGIRSRVVVFRKGLKNPPRTHADLLQPRFRNSVGISNPQFGTASDEAAALGVRWGQSKTLAWYRDLRRNGARVLPGNSVVAARVANGELLAGICDGDDLLAQPQSQIATLDAQLMAVPASVAILKGAPNEQAARRFVDALLLPETQAVFAREMPGVWMSGPAIPRGAPGFGAPSWNKPAPTDTARWADSWRKLREPLAQIVLAP